MTPQDDSTLLPDAGPDAISDPSARQSRRSLLCRRLAVVVPVPSRVTTPCSSVSPVRRQRVGSQDRLPHTGAGRGPLRSVLFPAPTSERRVSRVDHWSTAPMPTTTPVPPRAEWPPRL